MNKKQLKEFLDLTFNPENERARDILRSMKTIDEPEISVENYLRICLRTIPETKAEVMFICFSVGTLQGEYNRDQELQKN